MFAIALEFSCSTGRARVHSRIVVFVPGSGIRPWRHSTTQRAGWSQNWGSECVAGVIVTIRKIFILGAAYLLVFYALILDILTECEIVTNARPQPFKWVRALLFYPQTCVYQFHLGPFGYEKWRVERKQVCRAQHRFAFLSHNPIRTLNSQNSKTRFSTPQTRGV
jgi:hypothetical protein